MTASVAVGKNAAWANAIGNRAARMSAVPLSKREESQPNLKISRFNDGIEQKCKHFWLRSGFQKGGKAVKAKYEQL